MRGLLFLSVLFSTPPLIACNNADDTTTMDDRRSDDHRPLPAQDAAPDPTDPAPATDAAPDSTPGRTITRDFTESDAELLNPERGYYAGYDLRGAGTASHIRAEGKTLAITLVRLDAYRDRLLDAPLLTSLGDGFAAARSAGIKVILRFTYNSALAADASRARILGHLDQLAPLLHANADVIAVMQAGFIGAWGEWHSSTNGLDNDADRAAILTAILAALPSSRGVQVRTPMFKAAAFPGGPLDEATAYDGSARARVGHHNDCFLASDSDFGTYASPIDTWASYVADDGRYTAIGGETCQVNEPRTSCGVAIAEMADKHWAYLNSEYQQAVVAGWDAEGCGGEIRRRLGYRFALERVSHGEAVAPGGELTLEVEVHNRGFASPFNRRPVEVVLDDGTTRRVARLAAVDARQWAPGVTNTLTVRLRIPAGAVPGNSTLSLRLPDDAASLAEDPRYAIRFANDGVWSEVSGDNLLSDALVIDPAAPGPRDLEASVFAELP